VVAPKRVRDGGPTLSAILRSRESTFRRELRLGKPCKGRLAGGRAEARARRRTHPLHQASILYFQ